MTEDISQKFTYRREWFAGQRNSRKSATSAMQRYMKIAIVSGCTCVMLVDLARDQVIADCGSGGI